MTSELEKYVEDYIEMVYKLCSNMLIFYNVNTKTELTNIIFLSSKNKDFWIDNLHYLIHGRGCLVESENIRINWDFGYRSRWCGIEPYFVSDYIRNNISINSYYSDGDLIRRELDADVKSGLLFKKSNMYYYNQNMNNIFKPNFPENFDYIKISKNGIDKIVNANKLTKRFIRKAVWVDKEIQLNPEKYSLDFIKDNKIIYSIYYADVGYPESAISIMSDEIIKHL